MNLNEPRGELVSTTLELMAHVVVYSWRELIEAERREQITDEFTLKILVNDTIRRIRLTRQAIASPMLFKTAINQSIFGMENCSRRVEIECLRDKQCDAGVISTLNKAIDDDRTPRLKIHEEERSSVLNVIGNGNDAIKHLNMIFRHVKSMLSSVESDFDDNDNADESVLIQRAFRKYLTMTHIDVNASTLVDSCLQLPAFWTWIGIRHDIALVASSDLQDTRAMVHEEHEMTNLQSPNASQSSSPSSQSLLLPQSHSCLSSQLESSWTTSSSSSCASSARQSYSERQDRRGVEQRPAYLMIENCESKDLSLSETDTSMRLLALKMHTLASELLVISTSLIEQFDSNRLHRMQSRGVQLHKVNEQLAPSSRAMEQRLMNHKVKMVELSPIFGPLVVENDDVVAEDCELSASGIDYVMVDDRGDAESPLIAAETSHFNC